MKQIKKKENKKKGGLVLVALFSFFICLVSIFFSLKLSKNDRKKTALHLQQTLSKPETTIQESFFKYPFDLTFEIKSEDVIIYYTMDGSKPSLSSERYREPIHIKDRTSERNSLSAIPTSPRWKPPLGNVQKGTVIRAISVDRNNRKSSEFIRTFFVNKKGSSLYSIPVISITINEKDFFGYKYGIYVMGKSYVDKDNYIRKMLPLNLPWWEYPSNYLWRGSDSERHANIEFYEPGGQLGFEAEVGTRINGNATRGYAQKSLRINFRKEYGLEELNYDLFSERRMKINSFILRNSGNDWDKTMFRDALIQNLMKDAHLEIQNYRPSVVFINGEYWGIHNVRERFDESYLANKYNVDRDNIVILELSGKVNHGDKKNANEFSELLNFVQKNDLSKNENYEYVLSKIDTQSFIDFIIANVYFCNSDWPNNNVKFWKYDTASNNLQASVKDGRWRWMLYDTDWGFGYNSMSSPSSDLLKKAMSEGSVGILFRNLLKNENFEKEFLMRFQLLLNTTLRASICIRKIENFKSQISLEMPEHINRWRAIKDYEEWLENIEVLKDFAIKRPQFQADQLNSCFHLVGTQQISVEKQFNAH